jgi:galactose mutarotase-like enzyme
MAQRTWILTDLEQDLFVEQISIGPDQVGGAATGYAITKRTLRGGRRDGVDAVEIDNGRFRFVVLPTRGMGLWRARLADLVLGWKSPVKGPVNPAFVPLAEPGGLGWLDGFDELMCRCGLESNGAPEFNANGSLRYGLHGRIANSPAHHVELTVDGDQGTISVTGVVDEARLFFNKMRLTSTVTTRVGQPGLTVTDTVTNLSAEPGELELLYHTNFGLPLASAGAKAVFPVAKMAPRDAVAEGCIGQWDTYDPETPGSQEAVFFFDLAARPDGSTQALLRNAAGDRGVSLKFNKRQLPCFTLWKNRQAAADGYVTGLEPAINFPNVRAFEKEKGRVAVLAPGESRSYEVTIEAHGDRTAVEAAEKAVAAIQASVKPDIRAKHDPDWSRG